MSQGNKTRARGRPETLPEPTCTRNFEDPMRHRSCGLFGQGPAFQVCSHRLSLADTHTPPPCVMYPSGQTTDTDPSRSNPMIHRSEHPACSLCAISHPVLQSCNITPHNSPLPDRHCRYDPMTPPLPTYPSRQRHPAHPSPATPPHQPAVAAPARWAG